MIRYWIKCCYTDIFSCVINNGFSSDWFKLLRGMRQGCALSCYLFMLCVEIMECMIREDKNIIGLKIHQREHKIKQFAYDCACTIKTIDSLNYLIIVINQFTRISGLKLNLDKSLLVLPRALAL